MSKSVLRKSIRALPLLALVVAMPAFAQAIGHPVLNLGCDLFDDSIHGIVGDTLP